MYITLQSIKRNLGLFNLELEDLIIGSIFGIIFTILFLLKIYMVAMAIISIGVISLFPIEFSKCNRIYKLFILFSKFIFKNKNYYLYYE
jgi:hypothetical protein